MTGTFTRNHMLGYAALCFIWGSTWLAIRVVVRDVPPLEAAGIRFLAGAVLLLALAGIQRRTWPSSSEEWKALLVLSVTIMAVPYGLLFWAEQYVPSSMTAVLYSAMPLLVALFTPLMMQHSVPRRAVFALVIACGGLLLLFPGGLNASGRSLAGAAAILISVVLSSWHWCMPSRLQAIDSVVFTRYWFLFFDPWSSFLGNMGIGSAKPRELDANGFCSFGIPGYIWLVCSVRHLLLAAENNSALSTGNHQPHHPGDCGVGGSAAVARVHSAPDAVGYFCNSWIRGFSVVVTC